MMSLIMIDDDDYDAKRHWKSDQVLMTVWLLPLMMQSLGQNRVTQSQNLTEELRKGDMCGNREMGE